MLQDEAGCIRWGSLMPCRPNAGDPLNAPARMTVGPKLELLHSKVATHHNRRRLFCPSFCQVSLATYHNAHGKHLMHGPSCHPPVAAARQLGLEPLITVHAPSYRKRIICSCPVTRHAKL